MKRGIGLMAIVTAGFGASAASAESISISITAHVPTFCRIYVPDGQAVAVDHGFGAIGVVREICNTPQGYDVNTSFSNVVTGNLMVGGSRYAVIDGVATRSSPYAAVRALDWSLNDATLRDEAQPVIMQVTISPR